MAIELLILLIIIFVIFIAVTLNANAPNDEKHYKEIMKLWQQHFIYTVLVTKATLDDDPNLDLLLNKLIKNQKDIGIVFKKKYGKTVGNVVTLKLVEHVTIVSKILKAVENKNAEGSDLIIKLNSNAYEIGDYLDNLFKTNIYKYHFRVHVASLVNYVTSYAQVHNDYYYLDEYLNPGMLMAIDMGKNIYFS